MISWIHDNETLVQVAKYLTAEALEKEGFKKTELYRSRSTLMLFPASLYPFIPNDLEVVDQKGVRSKFNRHTHNNDEVRGFLKYGILANKNRKIKI